MLFSDLIYIAVSCHFFSLFICYHCVRYLYVLLQWLCCFYRWFI